LVQNHLNAKAQEAPLLSPCAKKQKKGPPDLVGARSGGPHAAAEFEHLQQYFNALIKQIFHGTETTKKARHLAG
jgi:hypothetical protein